jgi:hypothetical protein
MLNASQLSDSELYLIRNSLEQYQTGLQINSVSGLILSSLLKSIEEELEVRIFGKEVE